MGWNGFASQGRNSLSSENIRQQYCEAYEGLNNKEILARGQGAYQGLSGLGSPVSGTIPKVIFTLNNEKQKDLKLEQALIKEFSSDGVGSGGVWYYSKFDLNDDGIDEAIVQILGNSYCGSGGCSMFIFQLDNARNYQLRKNFPIVGEIFSTFDKFNGWNELITERNEGGGSTAFTAYRVSKKDFKYHPMTGWPSAKEVLCKKTQQLQMKYAISLLERPNRYFGDLKAEDGYWKLNISE